MEEEVRTTAGSARFLVGAFIIYLALTIVATWPLATHLGRATPTYWGDSRESVWVLAWDAHVLAHHPTQLFQAPVFYPERDSLAFMEPHLTLGILAAPIIWVSGNPYLGHNILFLLALPLSALAACALALDMTKNRTAAFVAGAAYAFSPWWLGHTIPMALIKLTASWWLPLTVLAVRRWMRSGSPGWLAVATISVIAATLQSWHLGTMVAMALVVTLIVAATDRRPSRKMALHGLGALLIGAAAVLPLVLPHVRVTRDDKSLVWTIPKVQERSANAESFLSAPGENTLWGSATARWRNRPENLESNLFPGAIIVLLAAVGVASAARTRAARSPMLLGVGLAVVGVLLSLGPGTRGLRRFLPWTFLHEYVFLFRSLRTPPRFHILTILGLSILAGIGATAVIKSFPLHRVAGAALVGMIFLEALSLPMTLGPAPMPTAADRSLRGRPGGALYLPTLTYSPKTKAVTVYGDPFADLLATTGTWNPIANGIPSIYPKRYLELLVGIEHLPDPDAMRFIRARDIRTLVVHTDQLAGSPWADLLDQLPSVPGVRLIQSFGPTSVYDVDPNAI